MSIVRIKEQWPQDCWSSCFVGASRVINLLIYLSSNLLIWEGEKIRNAGFILSCNVCKKWTSFLWKERKEKRTET